MRLAQAQNLAERIVETMQPYCERVAIAGSIRRQKPEVKDIEIVAIPKLGDPKDLFGTEFENLLYGWAGEMEREQRIQWIKPGTSEIIPWRIQEQGRYWRGWLVKAGIKLDLFLTTSETWGVTFLIRTGSAEFSQRIVGKECWRTGYRFDDGKLFDPFGQVVSTPEEIDVFATLGVEWIEPEAR